MCLFGGHGEGGERPIKREGKHHSERERGRMHLSGMTVMHWAISMGDRLFGERPTANGGVETVQRWTGRMGVRERGAGGGAGGRQGTILGHTGG